MKVFLQPDGPVFEADSDETVLEAAERAGIHLPFGCRNGNCGACRARLVDGEVCYPRPPEALSSGEQAAGLVLLCRVHAETDLSLCIADQPAVAGQQLRVLPARVKSRRQLNADVLELVLALPRSERLDYLPGQYLDILLKTGDRRSFSIANAPREDACLELHLRLVPDGEFTPYAFRELKPGKLLRLQAPLGSFFLRDHPRPAILIGGGTGFAPLKAMLESELARDRDLHLYWGARTRADLYLHDWALECAARLPNMRYTPVLSEPAAGDAERAGLVHAAVSQDYPDLSAHEVYMSGPPAMIDAGKDAFLTQGLDPENLYYDAFDYAFSTWGKEAGPGGEV